MSRLVGLSKLCATLSSVSFCLLLALPAALNGCGKETCGDGKVGEFEECDDSIRESGDGCTSGCVIERCGDGVVQSFEECDDGNQVSGDGCNSSCKLE